MPAMQAKGSVMSPRRQVTYSRRPNHAARLAHARGDRLFRTYDTSYIQPKRSNVPHYVFLAVLALLGIGILWFVGSSVASCVSPKVELLAEGQQATITVNEGASANTVGSALVDAKLVGSSKEFTERVKDLDVGSDLKPGTYTFAGGATVDDIISALRNGPVSDAVLTIPEGYRLTEIASAVESATSGRISADSFKQAASDASVYAGDYGFLKSAGTNSLEGFLFPKTYDVAADATADSLIRAMLTQFQTETAGLDWSYPESQGLSVYDTVNLASIVEKESSGDETVRAQVAAVFYNRLTIKGEPSNGYLQSDATTAYEVGHDPSADEVHANSPYSTYTNAGLPPTPICSPSIECLQAVCSPNKDALGKYYFFYFQNDKYTFSETYDEHQAAFS